MYTQCIFVCAVEKIAFMHIELHLALTSLQEQ